MATESDKPQLSNQPAIPLGSVVAVMSMPRLCFSDNMDCCANAFAQLGIDRRRTSCVFWGMGLSLLMEQALKDGFKYILTVDYDTVFTARNVYDLYRLMEDEQDIGAAVPVEIKRDSDAALMMPFEHPGTGRMTMSLARLMDRTIRLKAGHFGLTLIRAAALAKCLKPWFVAKPNADGEWGQGKTDEDIWFWKQWYRSSLTVHQANRVVVGHIQRVITWPNCKMGAVHQYLPDYNDNGPPAELLSAEGVNEVVKTERAAARSGHLEQEPCYGGH